MPRSHAHWFLQAPLGMLTGNHSALKPTTHAPHMPRSAAMTIGPTHSGKHTAVGMTLGNGTSQQGTHAEWCVHTITCQVLN
jgi:hypothetical protein